MPGLDGLEVLRQLKADEQLKMIPIVVFSSSCDEGDRFRVSGPRVERWVAEVDMDDESQVAALQRRLIRAGVERRLTEAGARRGDEVVIGRAEFEFVPDAAPERHTQTSMPDTDPDGSEV